MKTSRIPFLLLSVCILLCSTIASSAQNFGSVAIGSNSTATIPVTISTAGKVGSISVRFLGAENMDFTNAGSGTCAVAATYSAKSTCTVNVTFKPTGPGSRHGAIVLFDQAGGKGNELANIPVFGKGVGPRILLGPGTDSAIVPIASGKALNFPDGLAFDGKGDLFIGDFFNGRVVEVPAGGGDPLVLDPIVNGTGLNGPRGLAVDGAGDLFIADSGNRRLVEIPAGGGNPVAIDPIANGIGLTEAWSIAFDAGGDLYIADNSRILELPSDGGAPIVINPVVNGIGLANYCEAIAIGPSNDLFMSDTINNRVVEVPTGGGAPVAIAPTVNGIGITPYGLVLDAAGDLFIADTNNRVVEVPAGGDPPISFPMTLDGGVFSALEGLALDSFDNLFIADSWKARLVEISHDQPSALSFAKTPVGSTSTGSPQTVQVQNVGNDALTFSDLSFPADFSQGKGVSLCAVSTPLPVGQTCNVSVDFTPQTAGLLSEQITLTDNTLNLTGSEQFISVSGNSQKAQTITFAALPNVVLGTSPFTLKATATSGLAITYKVTGPATLSGSTLTLTGSGSVSVTASQPGDATYAAAPPVTRTFTVLLPPTVKFQTSALSATLGWPVTFTATVSGTGAMPTGVITFYSGSTSLGPATISAGVATLSTSALTLGSHSITAKYSGDTTYASATSAGITELITKAPTIALAASPNAVTVYSTITLTATVENPTGGVVPTSQVKFFADFNPIGLATLTNGVATLQISTLSAGQHYIAVEYLGDPAHQYIPAVVQRVWVGRIAVTLAVTSSANPILSGNPETLTATLSGTLADKPATGTIHFYIGNTLLGAGPLTGNIATFTTSTLPHGVSTITAQFWGDTNYLSTKSPNFTQVVQ